MTDARAARPNRTVGYQEGIQPWAKEAFHVLRSTAAHYGATITPKDLAAQVQARSGLSTTSSPRTWLGPVLVLVARACDKAGLPALTSLVVGVRDGNVGPAYDEVLRLAGVPSVEDADAREWHAAQARLACYREFGDVPEDAQPTLVARGRGPAVSPRRAAPKEALQGTMCPQCFIQMPLAGGGCPTCD